MGFVVSVVIKLMGKTSDNLAASAGWTFFIVNFQIGFWAPLTDFVELFEFVKRRQATGIVLAAFSFIKFKEFFDFRMAGSFSPI